MGPRLDAFPADIGSLFARAFSHDGGSGKRPTAHEWIPALEDLSRSLKQCTSDSSHHYFQGLSSCPWCTAEKATGIPVFGIAVTVIRTGEFDLIAVWVQIEAVQPQTSAAPQFTNAYIDQCKPDPSISEAKSRRRKGRLIAVGALLLAVIVVAPGTIPALFSVGLLIAGLLAATKLWKSNLLAWRHTVEQGFVFNPNEALDPADIRVLDQQIAQKRAALIQAFSSGPVILRQVLHPWQVGRSSAIANVNFWSKALAQAEVNKKALGRIYARAEDSGGR